MNFTQILTDATFSEDTIAKCSDPNFSYGDPLFQSAIHSMQVGFILQDHTATIRLFNPAAYTILGLSAEQLMGRTAHDPRWNVIREDGSHFPDHDYPVVRSLENGETLTNIIMGVYKPDGQLCWICMNSKPLYQANETKPSGAVITFNDITGFYRAEAERKLAEQALMDSEARYRGLAKSGIIGIATWNVDGSIQWLNDRCLEMIGFQRADLESGCLRWDELTPPEWLEATQKSFEQLYQLGIFTPFEKEFFRKDGSRVPVLLGGALLDNGLGGIAFLIDLSDQKHAEASLRASEQRLLLAQESGNLGSWQLDLATGNFIDVSLICKAHFGKPLDGEFTRDDLYAAIHPEDVVSVAQAVQTALENHQQYKAEYRCIWPDGSVHWIGAHGSAIYSDSGKPIRIIGITQDIDERKLLEVEREQMLSEAQRRADHDPLTGLLNHRAFHKRLEIETRHAKETGTSMAIVMLDLDNFKFFNDVYGHATGDEVLKTVASRLQDTCRSGDTIARFGGDEFALLLPNISETTVTIIEERLRNALQGISYQPEGHEIGIPINVSLGASILGITSLDHHEVLHEADERLIWSKTGGAVEAEAQHIRNSVRQSVEGFSMLDALVAAVDNKDRYTRKHSEDVMAYSLMIARELALDEKMQHIIAVAALLHDVGKIGIPDFVLRKPGKLTNEEFEIVKQHPQMGAIIVQAVPGLENTLDAVRHHHERWDGKGYPFGLRGEETPLIARLMAVADAFSAMTTDRPYRKGMEPEKALSILENGSDTQWDETCVKAFIRAHKTSQLTRLSGEGISPLSLI